MESDENMHGAVTVLQGSLWLDEESALIGDDHFTDVTCERQNSRILPQPQTLGSTALMCGCGLGVLEAAQFPS